MEALFDAVLFDLDGTLLNTLEDIAAAGNFALEKLGLPTHTTQRYRRFVGHGARYLIERAVGPEHEWRWDEAEVLFRECQLEHGHEHTQAYPGVAEMLDQLTARGVRLAVLSNKPDAATKAAVEHHLPTWAFDPVRGQRQNVPMKPDPAAAIEIAETLVIEPHRWMFLGDSDVDMQTAKRAGMFAVGATWGFRDEKDLRDGGADTLIQHPRELLGFLG